MGDLAVRVCMGDYVVEDRVLRFRGVTRIGDCLDARVAFPGADIPILRMEDCFRVRGRILEEGEQLRITLGNVDVWLTHQPRFRSSVGRSSFVDGRFVAVAAMMIAVGSWVDAAEAWIDQQPLTPATHGGATLKRLALQVRDPGPRRQVAAVRVRQEGRSLVQHVQRIADGPRHVPDDRVSRTGFYRWYRLAVPADPMARQASERLALDDRDAAARRTLANAAYNADRFDSAVWHYQVLSWADQADGGALLGLARAQRRRGHHATEIAVYRKMLETWEDHPGALAGLTTALARMGRLDEASLILEQLHVVGPDDPYSDMAAATLAALEGRDVDALEGIERAVQARAQLPLDQQIELRRDLALDPAFASLRKDRRLRALLRRHLGAAAPRFMR